MSNATKTSSVASSTSTTTAHGSNIGTSVRPDSVEVCGGMFASCGGCACCCTDTEPGILKQEAYLASLLALLGEKGKSLCTSSLNPSAIYSLRQ